MIDFTLLICALALTSAPKASAPAPIVHDGLRSIVPFTAVASFKRIPVAEPEHNRAWKAIFGKIGANVGAETETRSWKWNASADFKLVLSDPALPGLPKPVISENSSAVRVVPAKNAPAKSVAKVEDKLCTIVASDTMLGDVINLLSEQAGVNVLLLSAADTKVTVRLVKVKLSEALNHLCASAGLEYIKTSSAFVMGDAEKLKKGYPEEWEALHPSTIQQPTIPKPPTPIPPDVTAAEPIITKTYLVGSVDATGLAEALNTLFKEDKLQAVAGPASRAPDLGSAGDTTGQGSTGTIAAANPKTRMIILKGPESIVATALATARQLDMPRPQVAISVTIHDVGDDFLRDLGISWTPGGTTITETEPRGINFGSFVRSPLGFNAAIKALETKDKARLLANPNILVMDQERAFVLIGNKVNLPRLDRVDNNGQPIFTAVEYRAGIYLQVSPIIHENGDITLTLYPQVSTITGFNEVNGASYPNISTREAQTTLTVRTGETITMGGLLRDEEIRELERVPILGQIPFFGELFTRRRHSKTKSQVIITITPTLIKPNP